MVFILDEEDIEEVEDEDAKKLSPHIKHVSKKSLYTLFSTPQETKKKGGMNRVKSLTPYRTVVKMRTKPIKSIYVILIEQTLYFIKVILLQLEMTMEATRG